MKRRATFLPALIALVALSSAGCAGFEIFGVGANDPGAVDVAPAQPEPGGGGGAVGNPGGGGDDPAPGGGGVVPGDGMQPSIEKPVPGQLNPVAASVWKLEPSIDGRHVTVLLSWWSGPAPCSVLDSVDIVRDGSTITMTPREGADPAVGNQVACPAIAMLRGTIVDLGDLEPGAYTLIAHGDLAPVTITIK
jgi:hypothetical protein